MEQNTANEITGIAVAAIELDNRRMYIDVYPSLNPQRREQALATYASRREEFREKAETLLGALEREYPGEGVRERLEFLVTVMNHNRPKLSLEMLVDAVRQLLDFQAELNQREPSTVEPA